MNLRKTLRQGDEPHSSALNDILFILLFFFLIVATLANPNVIKLSTPKAASNSKVKQSIVVSIDSTQQYYVGTTKIQPDSIAAAISIALQKISAKDSFPTVVINADERAYHGNTIRVAEIAQQLKLKSVYAVAKP